MELLSTDTLEAQLVDARRGVAGLMARVFELSVRLEESEEHVSQFPDAVTWLAWNLGLSRRTARRWLRLGRRLRDLPLLAEAFASGIVSEEQLRLLLRIATAGNQRQLLDMARETGDADELREAVGDLKRQEAEEEEVSEPAPGEPVTDSAAHMWWNQDVLHAEIQVPGADGVMLEKAILRLAEQSPKEPVTGVYRDFEVRAGEALVQMASESLAGDGDHDRATVVVAVSADELAARTGPGWEAASSVFGEAELDRMLCDARVQPAMKDSSGVTVGVGRTSRKIPPWLRRLVETRDGHCRFPGCRRTRWLQIHHLLPWSQGGPTNLDNLLALCGFHHRLLHRVGLTVDGSPEGDVRFCDRRGRPLVPAAARWPAEWERLRLDHFDRQADERVAALAGAPP